MWKEQLLLLVLFAAFFQPASSQAQSHLDDDDNCQLKTSTVLEKLETCERETLKGDSERTQLWTDVVKDTISAATKQQIEESKSQFEQMKLKLNEVEKIQETLEFLKTQVQDNANVIKLIHKCQQWPLSHNMDKTNFLYAERKYFFYNITEGNWSFVSEWCAKREMQMAKLKTIREMDAVVKALRERETNLYWFWLSASDVGQTPGQFSWSDGTLVDGTTWHKGKIYKRHGDWNETTCVEMGARIARLSDQKCSSFNRILCQVPAALAACL